MSLLKTFNRGGIHPPDEKHSANEPITYGTIPAQLMIPVNQHIGKPAEIVAERRAAVKRGDLLAKSTGFVSSNVHSPLDGVVQKIVKFPLLGGQISDCIVIKPDNIGENFKDIIASDTLNEVNVKGLSKNEIKSVIDDAGIVGMGGAGFPTHVKLSPPAEKPIEHLIINGAECEPYITSDHRLMLEKSKEMVEGIRILQKLFDDIPVTIGIENNKPDAFKSMTEAAASHKNINVQALQVKYPQGGEKQLIQAITGREVPSKGLPMDVGVVVQNVATVVAIYDAFYYKRPLTERVTTISGNLVDKLVNIVYPMGTPVSHLFEPHGIDQEKIRLLIGGGPMMGRTALSLESPVGKTTSALLFFDDSVYDAREENPCIRCGNCIDVCPMGLAVTQLTEIIQANNINASAKDDILDCIECGSCSYVCPADRRLVEWMRIGKNIIRREK